MEEIAATAEVGVGTLYRHFGSKAALIDALFEQRIDDLLRRVAEHADKPTAWEGLCAVMRFFVRSQTQERGVFEVMLARVDTAADVLRSRVEPVLSSLIARAKSEGAIRSDFAATDVPLLTATIARIARVPGHGPGLAERHLELLLKGLGPTGDTSTVPPPLADDDFGHWLAAGRDIL